MTTDALGNWISCGSVTPLAEHGWVFLPFPSFGGKLFRFKFTCDWENRIGWRLSYCLFRFFYILPGEQTTVSESFRIYPAQENLIKRFEIPEELEEQTLTVRNLEVRRIDRTRYDLSNTNFDPIWSVEVEYQ